MRKPAHLGPRYGEQFQDPSVVAAYRCRPPYPPSVFRRLEGLMADESPAVLDLGAGRGEIARRLAPRVSRVDAVEPSVAMVQAGRRLSGGCHPRLSWVVDRAETAPLHAPYALITAGNSLHWMDWDLVMPRLDECLTPSGRLAIIDVDTAPVPWQQKLRLLIQEFSTNRPYRPYDLIQELQTRGLFTLEGREDLSGSRYRRTVGGYVEDFHSRNGFSRARMDPARDSAFDAVVRELVTPYAARDGRLSLTVAARITWGRPHAPCR
jgi:SAM-dependent methyltransferase